MTLTNVVLSAVACTIPDLSPLALEIQLCKRHDYSKYSTSLVYHKCSYKLDISIHRSLVVVLSVAATLAGSANYSWVTHWLSHSTYANTAETWLITLFQISSTCEKRCSLCCPANDCSTTLVISIKELVGPTAK